MSNVSIERLESLYQKYNDKTIAYMRFGDDENQFELEVKRRLSADDVIDVVDYVCNRVTGPGDLDYHPELKDYYLRVAVLRAYTNISLPKDGRCWDFVYGTPIFAIVTGHDRRPVMFGGREYDENDWLDVEQYERILDAIDQKINYTIIQKHAGG